MFVITLGDIIGISVIAGLILLATLFGFYILTNQYFCKHKWQFVDPSYGSKYWKCFKCGKKHDDLNAPSGLEERK